MVHEYLEQYSNDLILSSDRSGKIVFVNQHWERLGYGRDSLLGSDMRDFFGPFIPDQAPENFIIGFPSQCRISLVDQKTQQERLYDWRFGLHADHLIGSGREISQPSRPAPVDAEAAFRAIVDTSIDGIVITDQDFNIIMFNPAAQQLFRYTADEILQTHVDRLFLPPNIFNETATEQGRRVVGDLIARRKDGTTFPVELSIARSLHGEEMMYVGFLRDVTDIKEYQEKLRSMAFCDPVTGLYNRRLFEHDLDLAFQKVKRSSQTIYVVFLDINNFKDINDTYGHQVGDEILCIVANRLRKSFRSSDIVARLGGDEFVVLISEGNSMCVIKRLKTSLEMPMVVNNITLCVLFGIGYSEFPLHFARDARDLLRQADLAMYESKRLGKQQNETIIVPYSPDMER